MKATEGRASFHASGCGEALRALCLTLGFPPLLAWVAPGTQYSLTRIHRNPYAPMVSIKEEVSQLLERLPDDCSLEDIQYHLYVLEKIRRGLDDLEQGRTVSQEEVEQRLSQWRNPA